MLSESEKRELSALSSRVAFEEEAAFSKEVILDDYRKLVLQITKWKGEMRVDFRLYRKNKEKWNSTSFGLFFPLSRVPEITSMFYDLYKALEGY